MSTKKKKHIFLAGLCMLIVFILPACTTTKVHSKADIFIEQWNLLAEQNNSLTGTIKIDKSNGKQFYDIDGKSLEYELNGDNISYIKYLSAELKLENLIACANEFVELFNYEETQYDKNSIIDSFTSKYNQLIPSGVNGLKITFNNNDMLIEPNYSYNETLEHSNLYNELTFGVTFDEYIQAFNSEFEKSATKNLNYKTYASDEEYLKCAKSLALERLKAPSTANIIDAIMEEKDSYGRALITVVVDAQNSVGTYLRTNFCIVIDGIKNDGTFNYKTSSGITTYSGNKDATLNNMKSMNDFGKPRSNDALKIEKFTKEEKGDFSVYKNDTITIFVDNSSGKIFSICVTFSEDYIKDDSDTAQTLNNILFSVAAQETTSVIEFYIGKCFDYDLKESKEPTFSKGIFFESIKNGKKIQLWMSSTSEFACSQASYSTVKLLELIQNNSKSNPVPSPEPSSTPAPTISTMNYQSYNGTWKALNGYKLSISVTDLDGQYLFDMMLVNTSGGKEVVDALLDCIVVGNTGSFEFLDMWGNAGKGTILLKQDSIIITTEITDAGGTSNGIGNATTEFLKENTQNGEPIPTLTPEPIYPSNGTNTPLNELILEGDKRYYTDNELYSLELAELRILRNGMYALSGKIFESNDLLDYFIEFSWYQPEQSDVYDRLNEYQKGNITKIQQIEKEKGN
ncbi:YARHG domain-containing protein [Clostridia bacterium OttesenSCG-928-F22]|nr:YARHG domain-containing protein [Clostridia bacterium OttesenSCG-928-F22]